MSDNIPFELIEVIIKRIPIKSLLQFRSVSKAWKSLIDSHEFIAAHSVLHNHNHRLLVRYLHIPERKAKYVSIMDDHTFPQHNFTLTVPFSDERLHDYVVVGCSRGVFCFSGYYYYYRACCYGSNYKVRKTMVVLWNPSIRKSTAFSLTAIEDVFGFGICPVTNDPKVLVSSINQPKKVKVCTRRSKVWRTLTINQPCDLDNLNCDHVVIDRFIYWLLCDQSWRNKRILSFDLTRDEFGEVRLPDNLAHNVVVKASLLKIRESLALIDGYFKVNKQCFDAWRMMDDGLQKSFIKVYTIETPSVSLRINAVLGFRKTGDEPILEVQQDPYSPWKLAKLAVYEPLSEHISYPQIIGSGVSFCVFSYTETLLLLDQREDGDVDRFQYLEL